MSERITLITGSSSGIGLLTAVEMARRGYRVIATMRDLGRRSRLDEAASAAGVRDRIEVRQLDVTIFAAIPQVVNNVLRDHGGIDVLVNNAGFAVAGFAEDLRLDEIRRQFETNFFGQVAMTQAVLPAMRVQRSGHIIMVSSSSGRAGQPGISSYSASKFALEGWSEALRIELRSTGIRVVLVEPGSFETDIWTRNAQIGERAFSPDSPNLKRAQRFAEMVKAIPKGDARKVARLIASVAENSNPRLRYAVGFDAYLQQWFRRVMPWKWYERLMAKALKLD
jgi:NAD(P)-dependent dehydrogenase (short-subunit alcohol dehydrogenase family)